MKLIKIAAPIITILPSIAYIPVLVEVLKGFHFGGLNIIASLILSAITPSLDPLVLKSAWDGLQITIAIALISWIVSMFTGLFLGILSSDIFWKGYYRYSFIGKILKRILAIPRSIHEVIWGILFIQILGLNIWVAIFAIVIPYSSLTARVVSDQLDNIDIQPLIALRLTGAKSITSFITILCPQLIPILSTYGGYRLECSIRSATLLGMFGLGGIGTELYLTLQSLEFREMWSCLWMIFAVMISLENFLKWMRYSNNKEINLQRYYTRLIYTFILTISVSLSWLYFREVDLFAPLNFASISLPTFFEIKTAYLELPLTNLIFTTIVITFLAAGIAIGTPPLLLVSFPGKLSIKIQSIFWIFFRLIPPPLTAIVILFCTSPNISVAALSLGITNMGVMGRLLTDSLFNQNKGIYIAMKSTGSNEKAATLYGILSPKTKSYLAYASYRTDVLLRETAIVGAVGGVGLGWQLQESLSAFDWAQVIVITSVFALLTISGEFLCDISRQYWLRTTTNNSLILST